MIHIYLFAVTVCFNTTVVRDDEPAGSLKFIMKTNRPADVSCTVQVYTEDIVVGYGLETATGLMHIIALHSVTQQE